MKKMLLKTVSVILAAAFMLALSPPANADSQPQNGASLSSLTPTPVALVIGGSQITKGQGYLQNFKYLTNDELDDIRKGASGTTTYKYGLGDSYLEAPLLYSVCENHGTYCWGYRYVTGLDLSKVAGALGIDTNQVLDIGVKATDGMETSLSDAFGYKIKRYCYDINGKISNEVLPSLVFFESVNETATEPSAENPTTIPASPNTSFGSSDMTSQPIFGFGQISSRESNNCLWVKNVNKIRIGPEAVALTVLKSTGSKVTTSISDIVRRGLYTTNYSFSSAGKTVTHQVYGIPLKTLMEQMGVAVDSSCSLQATDINGGTRTITATDIPYWFVSWDARNSGSAVTNKTALRLYGPGQSDSEVVFADLTSLSVVSSISPFNDTGSYTWANEAINYLYSHSVVSGTTATTFSPDRSISRGDFMVMLYRAYNLGSLAKASGNFSDVAAGSYYYDAIAAAKSLGIATGSGDGSFSPKSSITREDAMTLLYRTLVKVGKMPSTTNDLSSFTDKASVSSYALDSIKALAGAGVINGSDGKLAPQGNMTRAQMAQVLYKALTKLL